MQIQGILIPQHHIILQGEIGVREFKGPRQNPRILEYHATTRGGGDTDEIPWCSSIQNWAVEEAGHQGTDSRAAKSWLEWGVDSGPVLGSITVIRRRVRGFDKHTGSYSGYHVAQLAGMDQRFIRLLGGNQGNKVCYRNYPLTRYEVLAHKMYPGWAGT